MLAMGTRTLMTGVRTFVRSKALAIGVIAFATRTAALATDLSGPVTEGEVVGDPGGGHTVPRSRGLATGPECSALGGVR
jgi:hypothetical protein